MNYVYLLHHLVMASAERTPTATALRHGGLSVSYQALAEHICGFAGSLRALQLAPGERIAIFLDKRPETVVACFGASLAGGIFVPINPVLKPEQVLHILQDCGVSWLVTDTGRAQFLHPVLGDCHSLRGLLLTDLDGDAPHPSNAHPWPAPAPFLPGETSGGTTEQDTVAIFYTSGSTGRPKGVVLSHRNFVAGAFSVAGYLENRADDILLAALPLSFDAGFSQLTTAFASGACVVLLNYLLPRDVLKTMACEGITGLTAVPPLWIQLARLQWPAEAVGHLRYFANTGGHLPRDVLQKLRTLAPTARPYLMYGLTEAFRATYLPPEEVDRRPDSMGRAIPNNEVLVLRDDGSPCAPGEPGELVQCGPLVAKGYWNDPARTAERFRPLPAMAHAGGHGAPLEQIAVFSGDTVRQDADGFLYFVGRRDEMIKTSGYRVSPTEIEDVVYRSGMVAEAVAFGLPDPDLGQHIALIVLPAEPEHYSADALRAHCRRHMPAYMQPALLEARSTPLPRNPNGKLDRKALARSYLDHAPA